MPVTALMRVSAWSCQRLGVLAAAERAERPMPSAALDEVSDERGGVVILILTPTIQGA